ncbi:hypothetical protein [Gloeocapsopsis dulcis]|uniref:hypothetical protein n=1 Tax=Gloeocapsopsis dulcis TaxID=2859516 RepID=UPI0012DA566C|nr:hypothetical protein [Gloeocapsopsis dulcis]WNN88245.1 hypothetical protein P0S91_18385 [Gloeocapsopsis dulcis]
MALDRLLRLSVRGIQKTTTQTIPLAAIQAFLAQALSFNQLSTEIYQGQARLLGYE